MLTLRIETVSEMLMVSVEDVDMAGDERKGEEEEEEDKKEGGGQEKKKLNFRSLGIEALIPYYGMLNDIFIIQNYLQYIDSMS